jgi:hypothetical protein
MRESIIWLHDYALSINHPVFTIAPDNSRILYIWDNEYLKAENYSLKRLVFIYETLCSLPIEIFHGDTRSLLRQLDIATIYIPATPNILLQKIISDLAKTKNVIVVPEEPFVVLKNNKEFTRFFSYWSQAKSSAFTPNVSRTK